MDPRTNPYTPNAGAQPPALVGRELELEAFDILLDRLLAGYTEQSMLITGLRGVGKTVLLNQFESQARSHNWVTVEAEITKNESFATRMVHHARRTLLQLDLRERWGQRARRAAAALRSFELTVNPDGKLTLGWGIEPEAGLADSGQLTDDLTDLFVAIGEAAADAGRGVVFLFDEIHFLSLGELEALIAALHKTVQRNLPITLVGAGLPQLPQLAGEAKSYAERLFRFPVIGRLDPVQAAAALEEPADRSGVRYHPDTLRAIYGYTEGYPYFLQEYGKILWDRSPGPTITPEDAIAAKPIVDQKLDESFFRVRVDRTTPAELRYLRAMAELGSEAQPARAVAELLDRTTTQLGPTRSALIDKGLLYTSRYGYAAFTVPQFDKYLRRTWPIETP